MANEVTTAAGSVGELVLAEQIALRNAVLRAARAAVVVLPLITQDTRLVGSGSLNVSFPRFPAIPSSTSVSEGSDLSNSAINSTENTLTASVKGVRIEPTDLLISSDEMNASSVSGADPVRIMAAIRNSEYARWAADGLMDTVESDLTALFGALNGGTPVGSTGVNITLANTIEASYTLDNNNAPGDKVCVLHPRQYSDLLAALATATGAIYQGQQAASVSGGFGGVNQMVPGDQSGVKANKGPLFDFNLFQTTNVPTANSAADREGAMFTEAALGIAWKWFTRVELERNASLTSTEVVVTAAYGVGELVDAYGVAITTDA